MKNSLRLVFVMIMLVLAQSAMAFDRGMAGEEYRQWLRVFLNDTRTLRDALARNPHLEIDEIDRICIASLAPHSRMTFILRDVLVGTAQSGDAPNHREISLILNMFGRILEYSIPSGDGGLWKEPQVDKFSMQDARVMYMHVQVDEDNFTPSRGFLDYHLPPDGVLERKVYPFLLFQWHEGRLRLAGVGQEYWGLMEHLMGVGFS